MIVLKGSLQEVSINEYINKKLFELSTEYKTIADCKIDHEKE